MCISATAAALLAAGTAASAGSAYMQGQAQQDQMEAYNRQASERNRRVSEQYADRQQKIYNARDQQEKLFQQLTNRQDAEQQQQRQFADERRAQLEQALNNMAGGQNQRMQQAEDGADERRAAAEQAGDFGVTSGYRTSGSAAPEVVRDQVDRRAEAGGDEGRAIADAGFGVRGFQDLGMADQQLFRSLQTDLNDTAQNARRSESGYQSSIIPIQAQNSSLNRAQRFYGNQGYGIPEPVFQQASTPFADVMGGLGNAATTIGAQNLFTGAGGGNASYLRGRTKGTVPPSDGLRG